MRKISFLTIIILVLCSTSCGLVKRKRQVTKWKLPNGARVTFYKIDRDGLGRFFARFPSPPSVAKYLVYEKDGATLKFLINETHAGFLKIELRYVPDKYVFIVELPEHPNGKNEIGCCLDLSNNRFYTESQIQRGGEKPKDLEVDSGVILKPFVKPNNH